MSGKKSLLPAMAFSILVPACITIILAVATEKIWTKIDSLYFILLILSYTFIVGPFFGAFLGYTYYIQEKKIKTNFLAYVFDYVLLHALGIVSNLMVLGLIGVIGYDNFIAAAKSLLKLLPGI